MSFVFVPSRILMGAISAPPTPPVCPDYGFPSLPRSADRCAEPWIEVYDAPCTRETIECLLFRRPAFRWRQHQLAAILARRPDPDAPAQAKYSWCVEVLEHIATMEDDTNVVHQFLSGRDVADHFTRTRAYLRTLRPMHGTTPVPLMFPEIWQTGTGSESVPPRRSALGYYVLDHLLADQDRVSLGRGAYLWQPVEFPHHKRIAPQVSLEKPRPVRDGLEDRELSARDLTLDIFREAPGRGAFLVARVERPTGKAPCMFVGPFDRECWHYERFVCAIAGAEATMDLLEASALDWVHADYNRTVDRGFLRYADYLMPYAESGMLAMEPDELRDHVITTRRREAQAMVGTAGGIGTAIAAAVPVAGAVVAVVTAVLTVLLEVLPMAYGGGGCPVLGFRRMLTDPDCAAPTPQGNANIAALLATYRTDVAGPQAPAAGEDGSVDPPSNSSSGEEGIPLWPLAIAGGGAALLLGALALRRRRRVAGVREEEAP